MYSIVLFTLISLKVSAKSPPPPSLKFDQLIITYTAIGNLLKYDLSIISSPGIVAVNPCSKFVTSSEKIQSTPGFRKEC